MRPRNRRAYDSGLCVNAARGAAKEFNLVDRDNKYAQGASLHGSGLRIFAAISVVHGIAAQPLTSLRI